MHYLTTFLQPSHLNLKWIAFPVIAMCLALTMACGQDEVDPTAAAPTAVPATATMMPTNTPVPAPTEMPSEGEDRPKIVVIGGGTGTGTHAGTGTGTGTGSATHAGTGTGTGTGSATHAGTGTGTGTGSATHAGTGTGTITGTGTGTGSVSGPPAAAPAVVPIIASVKGHGGTGGLAIPVGLRAETTGPATKSDGIFTPITNREIYQKISTDYQEIVALTNLVELGRPLPAAEILLLYEAGMHTRMGTNSRTLRGFALGSARKTEFPDSAAYYETGKFLDAPVSNAIRKRGSAEDYNDAQRRQAIQKGVERILYYWAQRYMILGGQRQSPGLVDEAWAVYVGEEVGGGYPNSLAAIALDAEAAFGRDGEIDDPLREAMYAAHVAASKKDDTAYDAAARDVDSRFNTIFYLGTVRSMAEALQHAMAGNEHGAGVAQVGGLHSYMSIQPAVAKASAKADNTIVDYFQSSPDQLTAEQRDAALAAINGTAKALLLTDDDLVTDFGEYMSPGAGAADSASALLIPVGLEPETTGPASKSDGIFTPVTNREIYQKISTDYQEIAALTNLVNAGRPLPAAEILLLYETGMHTRLGTNSRTLRGFALDADARSMEFPDSAAYYESGSFLDAPISNAIRKRGSAAEYTDAQRRQAIQKGLQRVLYYWAWRYMILGGERLSAGLVDEAWAVYVGEEVDGEYPNSLAATARKREGNFGREGSIDIPLRKAMSLAQQAAKDQDRAAYDAAAQDAQSRFNAMFYLGAVRYMNEGLKRAQAGNTDGSGIALVEGLHFYLSIQPQVAKASAEADKLVMAYFETPPDQLTAAQLEAALAAINGTAEALLLTAEDIVTGF